MFRVALLAAALAAPCAAQAATVDFEAQGTNAPQFIQPNIVRSQTLTTSGATFSGGAVIKGTDDFLDADNGDFTAAYTTVPYTSFANPLTIAFDNAMTSVSFELVNNIAGDYLVGINGGATQTYTLGDYANQLISLSGAGINKVTIGYAVQPQAANPYFDFAIDNVSFSAVAAAVPETSTWTMMIGGLGIAGGALRRRRAATALRFA